MACIACGFAQDENDSPDLALCKAWLHIFNLNKALPTKEQFEAMQRECYLPTHGVTDEKRYELFYRHYGWGDYDWPKIADRIKANTAKS